MRAAWFLMASVVSLYGLAASQTPILTVEISDRVPQVGNNITFRCLVTGAGNPTMTLNKVIVKIENKFLSEQIAIADTLTRPYKDLKRFSVLKTTDGDAQVLLLRITGVQFEDSGHYACAVPNVDNLYSMEILEVYRKPTTVFFDNYPSGSVVVIQEGERPKFNCSVPDVLPAPDVQIWLERDMISPKDITEQFLVGSKLNIMCTENPLEKMCPLHMTYTMIAENRDFNTSFNHDGKSLTCTAKMKQLDYDELSSTIILRVIYPPKFVCAGLWNGTVNMTNLRIVCRVYANPPSGSDNKTVTIKQDGRFDIYSPGDDTPLYNVEDRVMASTDSKVSEFTLVIKTVTEEHFGYVYYLYAANEVGGTIKEIRIAKSWTPLEGGAEASLRGCRLITLMLSVFWGRNLTS